MRRTRRSAEKASTTESKKKRARFAAQTEEVHGFAKDEKIGSDLDKIFSSVDTVTKAKVPAPAKVLRKAPSMVEEELKWDENEDYSSAFALGGLGDKVVKVTRDTRDLSMPELRKELAQRDLPTHGGREALVQRLEEALLEAEGERSPRGKRKAAPKAEAAEAKAEGKKAKAKAESAGKKQKGAPKTEEAAQETPPKKQKKSPAKKSAAKAEAKPAEAKPAAAAPSPAQKAQSPARKTQQAKGSPAKKEAASPAKKPAPKKAAKKAASPKAASPVKKEAPAAKASPAKSPAKKEAPKKAASPAKKAASPAKKEEAAAKSKRKTTRRS